jgi:hypothetical protein
MGDIGMIKGVLLAWKLCGERGVIDDVVVLMSSSGLGVYRREEGEETVNIKHTNATQMHDKPVGYARGVLMQC